MAPRNWWLDRRVLAWTTLSNYIVELHQFGIKCIVLLIFSLGLKFLQKASFSCWKHCINPLYRAFKGIGFLIIIHQTLKIRFSDGFDIRHLLCFFGCYINRLNSSNLGYLFILTTHLIGRRLIWWSFSKHSHRCVFAIKSLYHFLRWNVLCNLRISYILLSL